MRLSAFGVFRIGINEVYARFFRMRCCAIRQRTGTYR